MRQRHDAFIALSANTTIFWWKLYICQERQILLQICLVTTFLNLYRYSSPISTRTANNSPRIGSAAIGT